MENTAAAAAAQGSISQRKEVGKKFVEPNPISVKQKKWVVKNKYQVTST